jgi:hypothetical protein
MKMFRETLTFRETSRKILDIYVSAALLWGKKEISAPLVTNQTPTYGTKRRRVSSLLRLELEVEVSYYLDRFNVGIQ